MVQRVTPSGEFMQPKELKGVLAELELSQARFAEMLGHSPRTGQYWANNSVPNSIACIALLLKQQPDLVPVVEAISRSRIKKGKRS